MGTQRTTVPSSLQGNVSTIDTATLGIPVANWPADDCAVNEFFQPQEIVFDITLCGGAWPFVLARAPFPADEPVSRGGAKLKKLTSQQSSLLA